jgi:hypothetical protein
MEEVKESKTIEEKTIGSRKSFYILEILELTNNELATCGDTSYDKNIEINAIIEALTACSLSVIFSLNLAKPMLLDVLTTQGKAYADFIKKVKEDEEIGTLEDVNEIPNESHEG